MKMETKKLIDYFPNWASGGGILSEIAKVSNLEYINSENSVLLDMSYYGNHGDKNTGAFFDKFLTNDELTEDQKRNIAKAIVTACKEKWDRIYLAFQKEYNPIWNVDGTESETVTNSGIDMTTDIIAARTHTDKYGEKVRDNVNGDGSETRTYGAGKETHELGNGKETQNFGKKTHNDSIGAKDSETSIMAFNSSAYSKSNKVDDGAQKNTSTDEAYVNSITTDKKTDVYSTAQKIDTITTAAKTDTMTDHASTDSHTDAGYTDEHSTDYGHTITTERTRGGNIGVTMTQQLLTSEMEFRKKYNFYDLIFEDLDKFLTIPYYSL